jgi:hypothetical protein
MILDNTIATNSLCILYYFYPDARINNAPCQPLEEQRTIGAREIDSTNPTFGTTTNLYQHGRAQEPNTGSTGNPAMSAFQTNLAEAQITAAIAKRV